MSSETGAEHNRERMDDPELATSDSSQGESEKGETYSEKNMITSLRNPIDV